MAVQASSFSIFGLTPEAALEGVAKQGALLIEYQQFAVTLNGTTAVTTDVFSQFGKDLVDSADLLGVIPLVTQNGATVLGASVAQSGTANKITVSVNASGANSTAITFRCLIIGRNKSVSAISLSSMNPGSY